MREGLKLTCLLRSWCSARLVSALTAFALSMMSPSMVQATNVTEVMFDAQVLPKEIKFKGKLIHGVSWLDNMGSNIAIFSQVTVTKDELTSIYLYAYHYANAAEAGPYVLIRQVRDKEERCSLYNTAGFLLKSISLNDRDQDGVTELSFAYRLGCHGDISPVPVKLITLQKGEKYIMRGTTRVITAGETSGGERKIDPSFLKAPTPLLDHALKMWERETVTRY